MASCLFPTRCLPMLLVALTLLLPGPLTAQPTAEKLLVSVAPCPPFVISENGQLYGLGIFLWEQIAGQMGVTYELQEAPLNEMLTSIAEEQPDRMANVGISCLSITAERERVIDFSHSFYETYTGIAVKERGIRETILNFLANPAIWKALGFVLAAAVVVGGIFFALESRINPKLYSMERPAGRLLEALIVGVLFVTRGPIKFYEFQTLSARALAAILAISSTFLIAGITAVLASAFTLQSLRSQVTGLHDLKNVRVAALESSTSSSFLRKNGIAHSTGVDLDTLMMELEQGKLDALVSDAAVLKYTIKKGKADGKYHTLSVLPYKFDTQNYGFALERDSRYKEAINQALLMVRKGPEWQNETSAYLGK